MNRRCAEYGAGGVSRDVSSGAFPGASPGVSTVRVAAGLAV